MTSLKFVKALMLLAQTENTLHHFSHETSYGLVTEARADGSINVNLRGDTLKAVTPNFPDKDTNPTLTGSESNIPTLGYKYVISPDYQTSFVWYDWPWAGNPEGEFHVDEDELESRYSASWCAARQAWVDKYTRAFKAQECHLRCSDEELFPDPEERMAWELDGMLLACWLARQNGVDAVEYHTVGFQPKEKIYHIEKHGVGAVLAKFLKDIQAELE